MNVAEHFSHLYGLSLIYICFVIVQFNINRGRDLGLTCEYDYKVHLSFVPTALFRIDCVPLSAVSCTSNLVGFPGID